jgi:hypothetical protein
MLGSGSSAIRGVRPLDDRHTVADHRVRRGAQRVRPRSYRRGHEPDQQRKGRRADVSDPTRTDRLLLALETPGSATAISTTTARLCGRNTGGLQVVNHLPTTATACPPPSASSNFLAGLAEEGHLMRVTARVTDDAGAQREFYVDGRSCSPTELPFGTGSSPADQDQPTFLLHACATDTGGNRVHADEDDHLTADAATRRARRLSEGGLASGGVSVILPSAS